MQAIKSANTAPEMVVRKITHAMGFRYRLHRCELPGKPDLVFTSRRKVIFVHGCFWHQHPGCKDGRPPKSNTAYWEPKLTRNVARDAATRKALQATGWDVLTIWECQTRRPQDVANQVRNFLAES